MMIVKIKKAKKFVPSKENLDLKIIKMGWSSSTW